MMNAMTKIVPDAKPRSTAVRTRIDQVLDSRFGRLLERVGIAPKGGKTARTQSQLIDLAEALLSIRGKASGASLASAFFDLYEASAMAERRAFLGEVRARLPRDAEAIDAAIAGWRTSPDEHTARALHKAAESRCQKLIRLLNLAPGGTRRLIHMRADLLAGGKKLDRAEAALDADFGYVFASWFNAGFLELRRIDWESPAAVLERVIAYEAVHSITSWADLRSRVAPADRRCYGFFHPQMPDDPLIFVEVALTRALPKAIGSILDESREVLDPRKASHAIFYSISNCQLGLKGVPFGNYLIKQVAELLHRELPHLATFATLSPVPGFALWLESDAAQKPVGADALRAAAARYLVTARGAQSGPLDSVARFHLGNGARLEAVHAGADPSPNGLKQSHGVMVNYVYDLAMIEANLLSLSELDTVACSKAVTALVRDTGAK